MEPYKDPEVYKQLQMVAECILSFSPKEQPWTNTIWMEDARWNEPYLDDWSRTQQGFLLEICYGQPSMLWTPWGQWSFGGAGCGDWKPTFPKVVKRLGLTRWRPMEETDGVTRGPWYGVHKVDDLELAEPKLPEFTLVYPQASEIRAAWARFTGLSLSDQ